MTGFIVEKKGFTSASACMADVAETMVANGFTQIYPSSPFTAAGVTGDTFKVTLEASSAVDPLQSTQPWRVYIEAVAKDLVAVVIATPTQLTSTGTYAFETNTSGANIDVIGSVGGQVTGGTYTASNLSCGFINRGTRVGANGTSYPLSYSLSISPRGLFIGTWEDAVTTEQSSYFNWILVQRPVDRDTGSVITSGKAPVWCVNATNGLVYQFVVRESDILRPGRRRSASANTEDSEAIINVQTQVRLTEDGKYVVNFPSRLNTSRYRYPYELDMIGVTSADVVSQYSDVELTVYGESTPRVYHALQSNQANNTGMRVLVLNSGGGIS